MSSYLGQKIKGLREKSGLSQIELAKHLNVSNTTLSQYESGVRTPSDDIKIKIATHFQVSLDYLLGNTSQKEKPTPGNGDELTVEQQELLDLLKDLPDADFAKVQEYVQLLKLKRNP